MFLFSSFVYFECSSQSSLAQNPLRRRCTLDLSTVLCGNDGCKCYISSHHYRTRLLKDREYNAFWGDFVPSLIVMNTQNIWMIKTGTAMQMFWMQNYEYFILDFIRSLMKASFILFLPLMVKFAAFLRCATSRFF